MAVLDHDRHLLAARPGLPTVADKGYVRAELDTYLPIAALSCRARPVETAPLPRQALLAPIRQLIESVHDALEGQLDLELHGGRSLAGVAARVPSACSPSEPPSGTTAPPASRSPDP